MLLRHGYCFWLEFRKRCCFRGLCVCRRITKSQWTCLSHDLHQVQWLNAFRIFVNKTRQSFKPPSWPDEILLFAQDPLLKVICGGCVSGGEWSRSPLEVAHSPQSTHSLNPHDLGCLPAKMRSCRDKQMATGVVVVSNSCLTCVIKPSSKLNGKVRLVTWLWFLSIAIRL